MSESGCGPGVFINWIKGNRQLDVPFRRAVYSALTLVRHPGAAVADARSRSPIIPIDRVFSTNVYRLRVVLLSRSTPSGVIVCRLVREGWTIDAY